MDHANSDADDALPGLFDSILRGTSSLSVGLLDLTVSMRFSFDILRTNQFKDLHGHFSDDGLVVPELLNFATVHVN